MGARQAKKKQTAAGTGRPVSQKNRMAALNVYAVEIIRYLEGKRQFLADAGKLRPNMTGKERQRLFGAGVKNYGFVEKAYDVARENPEFMPPHLNVENLAEGLRDFENMRQLVFELEQYMQTASNVMLLASDAHYRNALRVYGSLQEQARNRVQGASPLYEALKPFFHKRKRQADIANEVGTPTEKQIEKDAQKLLHGKAPGEIIVRNESPRASGGKRTVVDNVRKGRGGEKKGGGRGSGRMKKESTNDANIYE